MSEPSDNRPLMLCATPVLKSGPVRIGRIGSHITLPRTVPIVNVVVSLFGALGMFGLVLPFTSSIMSMVLSLTLGGLAGWIAVSYSPLKGESMVKWLGLQVASRMNRIEVDGRPARAYVGVCLIPEVARGQVRILPGAVNVAPGSVDERGRFVDHAVVLDIPDRPAALPSSRSLPYIPDGVLSGTEEPHWAARRRAARHDDRPAATPPPAVTPPPAAASPTVPHRGGRQPVSAPVPPATPAAGAPARRLSWSANPAPTAPAPAPPASTPPVPVTPPPPAASGADATPHQASGPAAPLPVSRQPRPGRGPTLPPSSSDQAPR
jgi:hypothetical protein